MKQFLSNISITILVGLLLLSPQVARAQHTPLPDCQTLIISGENPLEWPHCTLYVMGQLIVTVINAALVFGALLLLFNLFRSSLDYITAGEKTDQLEKARLNIVWSVIGLFGIASVYMLYGLILNLIPGLDSVLN